MIQEGEVEFDDDAWENISAEAKDLISQMLKPEASRLSGKKVLSHPWILKYAIQQKKGAVLEGQLKRLKEFQKQSRFRKTILAYLSTRVTDEDVVNEKKLFEQLDKNKDGYITIKELQEVAKDVSSDIDIKNIIMSVDLDKNGAINYSEFIAATMNELITKDASKLQAAFKFFDKDNNGIIDRTDLKKVLESNDDVSVDEALIDEIVNECDYNGDGQIDYMEFYRCMSLRQEE